MTAREASGDPFLQKLLRAGELSEEEQTKLQALTVSRRSIPARCEAASTDEV